MEVLSVLGKVTGVSKVKDAGGKMKQAKNIQKVNVDRFEEQKRVTCKKLNEIEMRKLEILQKFETFSDAIERIQKRPEFKGHKSDNIDLCFLFFRRIQHSFLIISAKMLKRWTASSRFRQGRPQHRIPSFSFPSSTKFS